MDPATRRIRRFLATSWSSLAGVTKSFGPTRANSDISLAIARGDILGLVGGNGAGKSTLMRILCGVTAAELPALQFADKTLSFDFYNATDAQAIGIRIVHQELSLCGNLTVAENFFLEAPEAASFRPGWRKTFKARARTALDAVFPGNSIEVDREVSSLPIGERQMVEIARAAATPDVKLIILDEPTSSLGPERSQQLRTYIHGQAARGVLSYSSAISSSRSSTSLLASPCFETASSSGMATPRMLACPIWSE